MLFIFILGCCVGVLLGRLYAWMKYHQPEFQEEIRLKQARLRLQRTQIEAEEEHYRTEIDEMLNERMRG